MDEFCTHHSDPLGRISWPLLSSFFVNEDTVSFKFGGICVGLWVGSKLFCLFLIIYIFLLFTLLSLHILGFGLC